jgi:hypothetical protein
MDESLADDLFPAKLAPYIRWVDIEGRIFIIDLRRGEYFGLDKAHADAWRALALQSTGDHDAGSANRNHLLTAARTRGWLAPEDHKPLVCARPRKVSLLVRLLPRVCALMYLVRAYASMRVFGFEKTYSWAKSGTFYATTTISDLSRLESAKAVFSNAERFIFSRRGMNDCLPRSLALFVFLRAMGFSVRHCIGIRCFPFAAHAWVESIVGHRPAAPGAFVPISIVE